ncbi:MAG: hypothetical protein ACRYGK_01210 [Janthinobacterium lividum]
MTRFAQPNAGPAYRTLAGTLNKHPGFHVSSMATIKTWATRKDPKKQHRFLKAFSFFISINMLPSVNFLSILESLVSFRKEIKLNDS